MGEYSMISMILGRCTATEIVKSAIESISVLVVNMRKIGLEYLPVHGDSFWLSIFSSSHRVITSIDVIVFGVPVPLDQPLIKNSVYNRNLTSCERYVPDGRINWLNDNRTRFRFCHEMILPNLTGGIKYA
jgi:hypothetical protein